MTRKNYHRAIKTYILWLLIILLIVLPAEAKKRSKSDKVSQSSQSYSVQSRPTDAYKRAMPEVNGEVMIAPTGKKYHVPGCRTVRGERKIISRNQAIRLGYSSCGVCNPDVFLMNSNTTHAPQTQENPANSRIKDNSNGTVEWYEGGTLHNATVAQWKKATEQNKLATCADWLVALFRENMLNIDLFETQYTLPGFSTALSNYVDKASIYVNNSNKILVRTVALEALMQTNLLKKPNERQNIQPPKTNNIKINKEGQEWVQKNVFPGMAWSPSDMIKRFGDFEKYSLKNANPDSVQAFYFKNIDITFKIDTQKEIITGWSLGRVYD